MEREREREREKDPSQLCSSNVYEEVSTSWLTKTFLVTLIHMIMTVRVYQTNRRSADVANIEFREIKLSISHIISFHFGSFRSLTLISKYMYLKRWNFSTLKFWSPHMLIPSSVLISERNLLFPWLPQVVRSCYEMVIFVEVMMRSRLTDHFASPWFSICFQPFVSSWKLVKRSLRYLIQVSLRWGSKNDLCVKPWDQAA